MIACPIPSVAPSAAVAPDPPVLSLHAATAAETDAIGRSLAAVLRPGDVVALHGPLGAGKSHLARAVIRARLAEPDAEVPSPSYTLVNIYEARDCEVWHADLYRVDPDEVAELGLADAPPDAILLVEWAGRWPGLPARRLDIALDFAGEEGRSLGLTPRGAGWERVLRMLGVAR
jgi:tRNA threonylcarbamoyladenosine biosynthesis protein TsaE